MIKINHYQLIYVSQSLMLTSSSTLVYYTRCLMASNLCRLCLVVNKKEVNAIRVQKHALGYCMKLA